MLERLLQAGRDARARSEWRGLLEDCHQLLSARGESNSLVIAARAVDRYRSLAAVDVLRFLDALANGFDPDPARVLGCAEEYARVRSADSLIALGRAAESPRQELLRRLNRAPGATAQIVAMRAMMLAHMRSHPQLRAIDADFHHLLSSWFNPGFLHLTKVDWNSPASLLEKLIHHEAVHRIDGWDDLRRRLAPDRRCFAFFHPALPDEPLIFVEVALLETMPAAIGPLLEREDSSREENGREPNERFRLAAFYSISNCQPGLRGVNLGEFLIKRVAEQLQAEQPGLKVFCTLSPIPGFVSWLGHLESVRSVEAARVRKPVLKELDQALSVLRGRHGHDLSASGQQKSPGARPALPVSLAGVEDTKTIEAARVHASPASSPGLAHESWSDEDLRTLQRLCALYLLQTSATDERPSDPVARFHLNNGARLERINLRADLSRKGLQESFGLMVNYLYDLNRIEVNHESFANDRVRASRSVLSLL